MLRRFGLRVLVLFVVSLTMAFVIELAARAKLGFELWRVALVQKAAPIAEAPSEAEGARLLKLAEQLTATLVQSGDAEVGWIAARPPLAPRPPTTPALAERFARWPHVAICYAYNANFFENTLSEPGGLDRYFAGQRPGELMIFAAPDASNHPVYRFPPDAHLPGGLLTNAYGMRGRTLALRKAENVIRIACLGASTTLCQHGLPHSWPELLEHWLGLWAQKKGLPFRFEVLNAGREGIKARDIEAIYRTEVRPFDVDYVFWMEGANHFHLDEEVRWEGADRYAEPPPGAVPEFTAVTRQRDSGFVARHFAIQRLLSGFADRVWTTDEPKKPAQSILWPAGTDEFAPDLTHLSTDFLDHGEIFGAIDRTLALTQEDGVRFCLADFVWLVGDDITLDPVRDRETYIYTQRRFWPVTNANVARLAAFQNRVFEAFAKERGIPLLEIARRMPRDPSLFVDPMHVNDGGVRARGWAFFEAFLPILKADLLARVVPRAPQVALSEHPHIKEPRWVPLPPR